MRTFLFPKWTCGLMPSTGNVFAFLTTEPLFSGRRLRQSLEPELPNGDPLENPPPSLPDFPTDVPAPTPRDVPAWEPVDDPPPDTGEPEPKPRPVP
jgi:hypothetical protein